MLELLTNTKIHFQLPIQELVEHTLRRKEGVLNDTGALVVFTGEFTGRSPADKFIVKDEQTANSADWNKFNNAIAGEHFLLLKRDLLSYLDQQKEVWVRDAYACSNPAYRLNIRIVNENPWCNLFCANMFIAPAAGDPDQFEQGWLIIHAPGFKADPLLHGTRRANFTIISFSDKTILIGGTGYTGEIKKGIFTVLNFILPYQRNVLSMHCSANEGTKGDTALFFGLSGTGKTTLSSDPSRKLIGDDEHGWDDGGIFNFEGGCYAKVINLSSKDEPDIFRAIRSGALVENTTFTNGTNVIDFKSKAISENTRVSYPLDSIKNAKKTTVSAAPQNLFFLTCDAYGVFPPISKLSTEQAAYYFINGYTSKIAGTEEGIKEPQLTFSACFGAPFLPLHPEFYTRLFSEKLEKHRPNVWLVNTGWTGGSYGTGSRINITYTRTMISAALNGLLDNVSYQAHPVFGIMVPQTCPGVPEELLNPWNTWADQEAYYATAEMVAGKFRENYEEAFQKQY
jgi:phosphoenolpyruvate carboxykinase (ATP)